jgi:phospholipase C
MTTPDHEPAEAEQAEMLAPTPTARVPLAADPALENLAKIEHIVVLMMENRSFDHMLGFLTVEKARMGIEGPTLAMSNVANGQEFHVHPARSTQLVKAQDPSHGSRSVAQQIAAGAMSGFAANYAATRPQPPFKDDSPAVVMAYHTAMQLPVYAYLAENYCVCDHWFCSVPGETMPNRCYAVAGTSGGHIDALRPPRPYNLSSFCRHLKQDQWRWYSHDYVPMLWLIDPAYGLAQESMPAYFDRRDIIGHRSFLERAAANDLPAVSWIDPNFVDVGFGPAGSNDDHPPSDLHAGQKLVLTLFDAIARSQAWEKTLLIITYDEHGGFYDHLPPPDDVADDTPALRKLGPRVPALVISPWVEQRQVAADRFDHTSIIKTILARFCRDDAGTIPDMGARVGAAEHLGGLLGRSTPRAAPDPASYAPLVEATKSWSASLVQHALLPTNEGLVAPETTLTDFQEEFLSLRQQVLSLRQARATLA